MFTLDEQLAHDSVVVGRFPLCLLLMSRDANYPWFILVPQREGITEIHHLSEDDILLLTKESRALSVALMDAFDGHKLNVAALGNMVVQLHIHHVVRFPDDCAWPKPVWGACPPSMISQQEARTRIAKLIMNLGEDFSALN